MKNKSNKVSSAAASGAVALIFLILGFQIAIFSGNVFKFRQEAKAGAVAEGDVTDGAVADGATSYGAVADGAVTEGAEGDARSASAVSAEPEAGEEQLLGSSEKVRASGRQSRASSEKGRASVRQSRASSGESRNSSGEQPQVSSRRGQSGANSGERGNSSGEQSALRQALEASGSRERDYSDSRTVIAERLAKKKAETFEFDPNTVTLDELCRLGFSERQAQVILNYRDKGGRFRSAKNFEKMYVVDSAAFARLEPYIRIPKLDLNSADSEALLTLRGIGPYYASKILDYRRRLGGSFTTLDQLLEIDGFDRSRLDGFRDDVELRRVPSGFNIWEATQAQLEAHPYIGSYAAKGIIRFKRTVDTLSWSLPALVDAGILTPDKAAKLQP